MLWQAGDGVLGLRQALMRLPTAAHPHDRAGRRADTRTGALTESLVDKWADGLTETLAEKLVWKGADRLAEGRTQDLAPEERLAGHDKQRLQHPQPPRIRHQEAHGRQGSRKRTRSILLPCLLFCALHRFWL